MKIKIGLLAALLSASALAVETKNMISFDIYKAFASASLSKTKTDYDDSDIDDDETKDFRIAGLYGRRIAPHFQVLGLINYSYSDYDGAEWYKSFLYGAGLEYNFNTDFSNSFYVNVVLGQKETNDRYDGSVKTQVDRVAFATFGKRFPLLGDQARLTYSPDITIEQIESSDQDDFFPGSTHIRLNFLKLDFLF